MAALAVRQAADILPYDYCQPQCRKFSSRPKSCVRTRPEPHFMVPVPVLVLLSLG